MFILRKDIKLIFIKFCPHLLTYPVSKATSAGYIKMGVLSPKYGVAVTFSQ
jgi:hypothetical protein